MLHAIVIAGQRPTVLWMPDVLREADGGKAHCILIRHGGKHDWYQNPNRENAQFLATHIIKLSN